MSDGSILVLFPSVFFFLFDITVSFRLGLVDQTIEGQNHEPHARPLQLVGCLLNPREEAVHAREYDMWAKGYGGPPLCDYLPEHTLRRNWEHISAVRTSNPS